MKLVGLLENSLGGFVTIRGYADFLDLQSISKAENLQRDLIPEHKAEISKYLQEREDVFFPEIVLSYTLQYDFNALDAKSGVDPLSDLRERKDFESNLDDIKFKSHRTGEHIVSINLGDSWAKKNKPFSRLDGNHRLSAELVMDPHISGKKRYPTPFCLVLFDPSTQPEKSKLTIFNNINSKAKPLTSEEVLKSILGDESPFSESEIGSRFDEVHKDVFLLSKQIPDIYIDRFYPNLIAAFTNKRGVVAKFTILLDVVNFTKHNNVTKEYYTIEQIIKALECVNQEFGNFEVIRQARNSAFLLAALHIYLSKRNLKQFLNWLSKNHLGELLEVTAQSVLSIYTKIYERGYKVFVAMPYFSKGEVRSFNETYQSVINKLNKENSDLNLSLSPIMIHEGGTKDIVVDMLQKIEQSQIFIADITKANSNVAYELGFARSLKIPTIIVRQEHDDTKIPFDYEHDVRNPYKPNEYADFKDTLYHQIRAVLITNYNCELK